MRVSLTNLAHVKAAEFTDENLTIIVGDNGAGKTLLLETISYIKDFYQKKRGSIIKRLIEDNEDSFVVEMNLQEINEIITEDKEVTIDIQFTLNDVTTINEQLGQMIKQEYEKATDGVNQNVLLTENSDFSFELIDLDIIQNKTNEKYQLTLKRRDDRLFLYFLERDKILSTNIISLNTLLSREDVQLSEDEKLIQIVNNETLKKLIVRRVKDMLVIVDYDNYFGSNRILYLPSERNLLMDNTLMKAASDLESESKLKRRFSERLFTSSYLKFKHYFEMFPELIEMTNMDELFGGTVKYSDDGEIESIEMMDGKEIKRELFSTKQNRLIPYLLIEYPISPYKEIIIEEPEAHLSLKSQKEFLAYFKSLLNKRNKKFYITTHSDVFFTYLNNLLLEDPSIKVNVYELIEKDNCFYLEQKERTAYGYEINMFTNVLNELFDQTLKLQEKNNS